MSTLLIILGAGEVKNDGLPYGIQQVTDDKKCIIEWQLDSLSKHCPEVLFVGGYEVSSVIKAFPNLTYRFNPDWKTTGPCSSLLVALDQNHLMLKQYENIFISYSDILFDPFLVEKLSKCSDKQITIATEAFSPEKQNVKYKKNEMFYLNHVPLDYVGLARVPKQMLNDLRDSLYGVLAKNKRAHLSSLFEDCAIRGISVTSIESQNLWAHAEDSGSVSKFILGTKANTLHRLRGRLKHSTILPLIFFTRHEFEEHPDKIIKQIIEQFSGQNSLIVRSSALDEDGFEKSNAGKYFSKLGVTVSFQALNLAIKSVFSSYSGNKENDQVLIQPLLQNVKASGVIFTRTLDSGAPYWVMNLAYGSDTTAITNGSSDNDEKLFVSRFINRSILYPSQIIQRSLLEACTEIEHIVAHDALDIEVAVNDENEVFMLQVRPLVVNCESFDRNSDVLIKNIKQEMFNNIQDFEAGPGQVGDETVWSVMADWNPAEMIGVTPGLLAYDLYKYLITDEIWARQRYETGYRDLRGWPLMQLFSGHAFIDVRASLNSFVPADIPVDLAFKLVDQAIKKLKAFPQLHDKIEFELLPTCLDFGFPEWHKYFLSNNICNKLELTALEDSLRAVTKRIIEQTPKEYAKILELEKFIAEQDFASNPSFKGRLKSILEVCKYKGVLPFAHMARSGFVVASLVRSAVNADLISDIRSTELMASIPGLGNLFAEQVEKVQSGELSNDEFVKCFGHLRPGTYDISQPAYRTNPEKTLHHLLHVTGQTEPKQFQWTEEEKTKLNKNFSVLNLDLDAESFLDFARLAVFGREYAKFVFTKLLSRALDEIEEEAESLGIPKELHENLPLNSLLDNGGLGAWGNEIYKKDLLDETYSRAAKKKLVSRIKMPPVITSAHDVWCFKEPKSVPSFVTQKFVSGKVLVLNKTFQYEDTELAGYIVAIENADPGFDYLFGTKIKGFITGFGGPNSHMAIRAAEFSIPAVIGVGMEKFEQLTSGENVEIDCGKKRWRREAI